MRMNTCCSSYNETINNRTKLAFLLVRKAIWDQRLAATDYKNAENEQVCFTPTLAMHWLTWRSDYIKLVDNSCIANINRSIASDEKTITRNSVVILIQPLQTQSSKP